MKYHVKCIFKDGSVINYNAREKTIGGAIRQALKLAAQQGTLVDMHCGVVGATCKKVKA